MYPHERSLVKRLADEPFALIGVNADPTREEALKAVADESLSWRSFWNGPKGPGGPISADWNVSGWPTIYVLDADGVIRYKSVGAGEYEPVVDQLLAKMESAEGAGGSGGQ